MIQLIITWLWASSSHVTGRLPPAPAPPPAASAVAGVGRHVVVEAVVLGENGVILSNFMKIICRNPVFVICSIRDYFSIAVLLCFKLKVDFAFVS